MIRPHVREACDELRGLAKMLGAGEISPEQWLVNVIAVLSRVERSGSVTPKDRTVLTAATQPRIPEASQDSAAQLFRGKARSDSSNRGSVQGHGL